MAQSPRAARAKQKFEEPGHYTDKDREKIDDADFAGPHRSFPILTQQDVHDAARLIGHADDPEAVKRKIISIAKRKGFSLPKEWQEEGARSSEATDTRAADESALTRVVLPAEIRITDAAKREFEIVATSEAVDSFGTVFSHEASKDAFSRWKRNIREMHAPLAVGRGIEVRFDDESKRTFVTGRVSRGAESTWLKLEDGVLQGASIGASNVKWERRVINGREVPVATHYDLVELSLVDNPSNPDSYGVTLIRSAAPAEDVWQSEQELQEEEATRMADTDATDTQQQPLPPMVGSATTDVDLGPLTRAETAAATPSATVDPIAVGRAMRRQPTGQTSAWIAKAEADNTRALLADEIRRAGDAAEASVGPLMLGEDFPAYAARVAQARGLAESKALLAQKQRVRAEREQTAASAAPTTIRAAESEATATTASADSEEQRSRMPRTVSSAPEAQPAKSEDGNNAIVETADRPADSAASAGVAPSAGGAAAVGAQATMRDEEMHEHDHEHIAPDGTRSVHKHPHGHAEAGHDHMHTFRAGQPTDARLVSAQEIRASVLEQSAKNDGYSATSKARPVSGSAQKSGAAESGLEKLTPAKVGHPVAYNTETVEAFPFGVPEQADERESGDEEIQLDPADFHTGGHQPLGELDKGITPEPASGAPFVPMIASRPPEPTPIRESAASATPGHEGRAAKVTSVDDGRPASGVDDTSDETAKPPADGDADTQPGYAESEGEDSDADDVRETAKPEKAEKPAKRADLAPEATRRGARLSAESMTAVHNMRDTAQQTINHACELCGCPECKGLLAVMNGGPYDALGQEAGKAAETADTSDDTALFGQLRVAQALVTRLLAEQQARHEEQLAQMREQMEQQAAEMRAALADVQLTVVDHQRGYSAQVTRAMQSQFAETISQTISQTTQTLNETLTSQIERQMPEVVRAVVQESVAQHLTGLAASVAEVKAGVETIANQPAPTPLSSTPVFGGADKVLPLHARSSQGQLSPTEEIAVLQRLGARMTDQRTQTALATEIMRLQGQAAR